jgi:hypothetical protein
MRFPFAKTLCLTTLLIVSPLVPSVAAQPALGDKSQNNYNEWTVAQLEAAGGTLQTAIDFNNANTDVEMPYFNQDLWLQCESLAPGPDDPQPLFGGMTWIIYMA